jgi:RimJ/RimL family protein N-acetyltransferase
MNSPAFLQLIETPRMWLRWPLPGDGEALYRGVSESLQQLRQWPDSLPWAQNEQSPRVSEDYCQTCYAACVMQVAWPMLLIDKASEDVIGTVGFHHIDGVQRIWELGYWCRWPYQKQGRMSEAVLALTEAALGSWPGVQLTSRVDQRNVASVKVLERAGYECVREERTTAASGSVHVVLHYACSRPPQTGQSS